MPPKQKKGGKEKPSSDHQEASSSNATGGDTGCLLTSELVPISAPSPDSLPPFSLATWNVLAHSHVFPHYYPQCSKKALSWGSRFPILIERLQQLHPDVLCMQEVDQWKDWEPRLKSLGYTSVYLARGGDKDDGCSISFKTERFTTVRQMTVNFDDIASFPAYNSSRVRKHCVALGLVLRPLEAPENAPEGSHDFFVVTTHLFWNPKFEEVKLQQALFLTYNISQFWEHPNRLILCGDMNSTPDSALATYLRTGQTDLRTWDIKRISGRGHKGPCESLANTFGLDTAKDNLRDLVPFDQSASLNRDQVFDMLKYPLMTHKLHLSSVYADRTTTKNKKAAKTEQSFEEPITSHFKQFSGTLDYIFVTPEIRPLSTLRLPRESEYEGIGLLPRDNFASDHLILMAHLQLVNPAPPS